MEAAVLNAQQGRLRRFWPYLARHRGLRWRFGAALALGMVYGVATGGAIPYVIQRVMPVIFEREVSAGSILLFCLLPVLVMGVRAVAGFGNTYLLAYCGQHVLEDLRQQVFDTIQALPLGYFQKNRPGELISRAMQETQVLRDGLTQLAQDIVKQPVTMIAALTWLTILTLRNHETAYLLLFIVSVPVVIVPLRYFGKRVARRAQAMLHQQAKLTEQISQNLGAIYEIRAFNLEQRESERFAKQCRKFTERFLKVILYHNFLSPAVEIVAAIAVGIALYYSHLGQIDTGTFVSLIMALYLCYEPVKRIGRLHGRLQEATAALDRIEAVLHHPVDLSDPEEPAAWPEPQGQVRFAKVSFSYGESLVLHEINVTVEAGETVALVGPSGAGKTTFTNLIPRFFEATEGAVFVDGIDVRRLPQRLLREHLAIVSQDPVLFHDTIGNNIRVGRLNASDGEVCEAAQRAHLHDFIATLPQGYNTICGERGGRLSGGQRQRVALARAFLRNARILILDEATSALDAESEVAIQDAVRELCRGKTVFIIAHRFSSIRHANRILVFDEGRIVENGTHAELLTTAGLYARLHAAQANHWTPQA